VRDRIEILGQIGVYHFGVPFINGVVDFPNRIERTALGTVAIGRLIEVRFKNRFEHQRKAMGLFGLEPCRRHPPASQT
jgi:hypothetical protein